MSIKLNKENILQNFSNLIPAKENLSSQICASGFCFMGETGTQHMTELYFFNYFVS